MQSLLVKLAALVAMIHMALGCAWHHGSGSAHACQSSCHQTSRLAIDPSAANSCNSNSNGLVKSCCGHEGLLFSQMAENTLVTPIRINQDLHIPQHSACHDDRCAYTVVGDFDCDALRDVTSPWTLATNLRSDIGCVTATSPGHPKRPCIFGSQGLRAHLALGVQRV